MKKADLLAAAAALVALVFCAPGASAQTAQPAQPAPILNPAQPKPIGGQPISAPVPSPVKPVGGKPIKIRKGWLSAEVIHADSNILIVRETANERMIHTFTYDRALKPRMEQIEAAGGYHYGDKVKILRVPGRDVALKIHGKPSPST